MLAATTAGSATAILRCVEVERIQWLTTDDTVPIESVGQAAAGALLVAISFVELALGYWAAGWQQRAVALSVACVGVGFLVSGIAEIASTRRPNRHRA